MAYVYLRGRIGIADRDARALTLTNLFVSVIYYFRPILRLVFPRLLRPFP